MRGIQGVQILRTEEQYSDQSGHAGVGACSCVNSVMCSVCGVMVYVYI